VAGVQEIIGASNSLLISPGSTSLALAGAGDHIFRLAPNDSYMVAELVDLIWARGHRYLALVYRDDSWGNSVADEMQAQFTQKGATVISAYEYRSLRTSELREVLEEVVADIDAEAGVTAGTYALLTYDAMRIAAKTLAEAGSNASYEELETTLEEVLQEYEGLSGQIELDAMGDRVGGTYDFYTIQNVGGTYQWVLVNEG